MNRKTPSPLNGHALKPLPPDPALAKLRAHLDGVRETATRTEVAIETLTADLVQRANETKLLHQERDQRIGDAIIDGAGTAADIDANAAVAEQAQVIEAAVRSELDIDAKLNAARSLLDRLRSEEREAVAAVNQRRRELVDAYLAAPREQCIETARAALVQFHAVSGVPGDPYFAVQRFVASEAQLNEEAFQLKRNLLRSVGEDEVVRHHD